MSDSSKNLINSALARMLRPILRVLIKNEVSFAEFAEIAKSAYVDVAYEHFTIPNRKTTFSRVAVLTGLSRKEVVKQVKLREQPNAAPKVVPNRAQRVVIGWLTDSEFLDEDDKPRELPIQGDSQSFAQLVVRYSGDITLGAVLDELTRIGVAEVLDKTHVRLVSAGYIPQDDELEKIRILSISASDLLITAEHNLRNPDQSRFQRQLVYQNCTEDTAEKFLLYSSEKSAELLRHLNQHLVQLESTQASDEVKNIRVGLGIYSIYNEVKQGKHQ